MKRIGFVLTAGQRREVFLFGIKLPSIFSWPPMRAFILRIGGEVRHVPELKEETKARIKVAVELLKKGTVDSVFVSGGYIAGNYPDITKEYLLSQGVTTDQAQTSLKSMDTIGNIEELTDSLKKSKEQIEIELVTSHYHMLRAKWAIAKILGSQFTVLTQKAYPPLTYSCLMEEYLYNLLSEPFKILFGSLPSVRKRHLAIEKKAREQEK